MTHPLSIDSDALKAATRQLRALVRARTGQDVPHASVLNTLVAGLGLGRNHGEMMARLNASATAAPSPTPPATALVLVLSPAHANPIVLTDTLRQGGWSVRNEEVYDMRLAWLSHPCPPLGAGWAVQPEWQEFLGTLAEDTTSVSLSDAPDMAAYAVDFLYKATHQLCTASVCAAHWDALLAAGIREDEALFALAYDIEMSDEAVEVLAVYPG